MFIQCLKHYHQWLHSAIYFKAKSCQISFDSVRIQDPSKKPSSGHLYPVSTVKECNRKGGKCKISQVLQFSVPHQRLRWRRVIDISKNGNCRVDQDLPDSRGMGIVDSRPGMNILKSKCS